MRLELEQVRNIEAQHLKAHNMMQIELAKRMFGYDLSDEKFGEWATNYSAQFRLILDKLVDEKPTILDDWEIEGNRDEIMLRVEELLYGKDGEKAKGGVVAEVLDVDSDETVGEPKDRTGMV